MAKKEIFICFSTHGGEDLANHLYKFCEGIGYGIFFSSETIRLGHNWPNERDKALGECEKFIFIATADAAISDEVAYEIRKAKELRKHIIPCKHTNIKNWSQLKKFEIEYNRGINFHTPHELVRELSGELMVIPQQQSSMQKDTEQPTGFRRRVKSLQCVFRFTPPNNDSSPELTRESFIQGTKKWIDHLTAAATYAEDKSDNNEIVRLLRFSEGDATISFDKDEDGNYHAIQRGHEWYARLIVTTDNLEIKDRIVREVDRPYWVYRMILMDKLDVPYLTYIQSQIKERTGEEPTGWSTVTVDKKLEGKLIIYHFGKLNGATLRLQLSGSRDGESAIEIVMDGSYDEGFYQAHKLFTYDIILSIIYGKLSPFEKQKLIKNACSKPSK